MPSKTCFERVVAGTPFIQATIFMMMSVMSIALKIVLVMYLVVCFVMLLIQWQTRCHDARNAESRYSKGFQFWHGSEKFHFVEIFHKMIENFVFGIGRIESFL